MVKFYWRDFKTTYTFFVAFFPVFTAALIFSDNAVSDVTLFESMLLYLCQSDKDLITTALKEDFSVRDRGELFDLLDSLDVTTLPTSENLKKASFLKQLIQKPRYVAAKKNKKFYCWQLPQRSISELPRWSTNV